MRTLFMDRGQSLRCFTKYKMQGCVICYQWMAKKDEHTYLLICAFNSSGKLNKKLIELILPV